MAKIRQKAEHKKVISLLDEGLPLDVVLIELGILASTIQEWRRDVKNFNEEYLAAIGLSVKQEQFVEQYSKKMLNVAAACSAVGIHRSTYYNWLDTSDIFKQHVSDAVEKLKDDAESILYQKLFVDKEAWAFEKFSKSKMKDRGYADAVVNTNINVDAMSSMSNKTIAEIDDEISELQKRLGAK